MLWLNEESVHKDQGKKAKPYKKHFVLCGKSVNNLNSIAHHASGPRQSCEIQISTRWIRED